SAPAPTSAPAPAPGRLIHLPSPKFTFSVASSRRVGIKIGRRPASSARSATLAERFADLIAENVATARTSVPSAVATLASVDQSTECIPLNPTDAPACRLLCQPTA